MAGAQEHKSAEIRYRLLRELGQRSQRTYAALREDGTNALYVVQRFARDARVAEERVSPEALTRIVRDARCLSKNWHPNIARVRHVDLVGGTIYVATDFVDGITLEDLLALVRESGRGKLDEPLLARIFVDVLSGLGALHGLRENVNTPLHALHGELCPANVIIGRDGVARIVGVFRPRPIRITAASEALGYASPETLAGEVEQDARIDLWAAGVMLWEALTGERLYDDPDPARIAQRQREEDVRVPTSVFGDVAMKAIAFDPLLRFRSAHDMVTSMRALDATIAPGSAVAQLVVDLAGERIRTRRTELHPGASGQRRAVQAPPKPTRSGELPRVSVATSIAPPDSTSPLPIESPPDSRRSSDLMRASKARVTPPPGRIRRLSSRELRVAPPAPDLETTYAAAPDSTGLAPPPVIAHALSTESSPPSSRPAPCGFGVLADRLGASAPPAPPSTELAEAPPVSGAVATQTLPSEDLVDDDSGSAHEVASAPPPSDGSPRRSILPRVTTPPPRPGTQPPPSSFSPSLGAPPAPAPVEPPTSPELREPEPNGALSVIAGRPVVPVVAGIAVLAIALLLAGAAIISRRTANVAPASVTMTSGPAVDRPPSTVVVAPAAEPTAAPSAEPNPDPQPTTTTEIAPSPTQ